MRVPPEDHAPDPEIPGQEPPGEFLGRQPRQGVIERENAGRVEAEAGEQDEPMLEAGDEIRGFPVAEALPGMDVEGEGHGRLPELPGPADRPGDHRLVSAMDAVKHPERRDRATPGKELIRSTENPQHGVLAGGQRSDALSLAQVACPTTPSTLRPSLAWNARIAAIVRSPHTPSTEPGL